MDTAYFVPLTCLCGYAIVLYGHRRRSNSFTTLGYCVLVGAYAAAFFVALSAAG